MIAGCFRQEKMVSYQPLPFVLVPAILGIVFDKLLSPAVWVWAFFIVLTMLGWFFLSYRKNEKSASLCLLFLCFLVFGLWHHYRWSCYAVDDIGCYAAKMRQPVALRGGVAEMPRHYPKPPPATGRIFDESERSVFTLRATALRDGTDWIRITGYAQIIVNADCRELRIGDTIEIFGQLSQPLPPQNQGDYDYAEKLRSQRILTAVFCKTKDGVALLRAGGFSISRYLESLRRLGIANLEKHLSERSLPLAAGMIFGVRESVDDNVRESLLETGTIHIMAISGLHVALVAGIVAVFLRLLNIPGKTTALLMILTVVFYLLLTDVRPPAIRATVLVALVALALYNFRLTKPVNLLAATALVVLIINPAELFQFGSQLSFLATAGFLWIPRVTSLNIFSPLQANRKTLRETKSIAESFGRKPPLFGFFGILGVFGVFSIFRNFFCKLLHLCLVSLIIWLITMPLILQQIHLFTPVGILVNPLLWIPLTPGMVFGFLTTLLGQVPLVGALTGTIADYSFIVLLNLIAWFQQFGGHYWLPAPPVWWNLIFYTGFFLLTFLPVKRPKWRIIAILLIFWCSIGILAGCYQRFDRLRNDRFTLSVFSVGHGNCVMMTTPENKVIVCDVGCIYSPQRATNIVSNAVWRLGKTHIDTILISHPDIDHFNGVLGLLERFSVGAVLVSPYIENSDSVPDRESWRLLKEQLRLKGVPIKTIADGNTLKDYGAPRSQILHPPRTDFTESGTNATSIVLRVEHRGTSVMLTGDLDGTQTSPFLLRPPQHTDIVLMPHHGGKSNQAEKILDWASPKTLLFSAGTMTYKPEAMAAYREKGCEVRNTFEEGQIEINIEFCR
ncbi:competence protein ComEC [Planctomycetales bacterium]|nr:competence protein ComEC [Planctomycetales bacterium]